MAPTIEAYDADDKKQLYGVDFFGMRVLVTVTDTTSVIRRWIYTVRYYHRHHLHRIIVGFGVQWSLYKSTFNSPVDTLQLCVGHRCLIIQLNYCDYLPRILRRFLRESSATFVGVWNGQDKKRLRRSKHQLEIGNLVDIKNYVKDSNGGILRGASFEKIVEEYFGYEGVSLDPDISTSDWDRYRLRHDQILQATVDAYVCFKLGVEERLWKVL